MTFPRATQHAPVGAQATSDIAEAALVAEVRAGNDRAFERMFRMYAGEMGQVAYRYVRSTADAEDVVMAVFHRLWVQRHRWAPRGSLAVYLRMATRNQALNVLRSQRTTARLEDRALDDGDALGMGERPMGPEEQVVASEILSAMWRVADHLPKRQGRVFLLKWRDGLTNAGIAERLGISLKAVEVHLTRAMRVVRARVRKRL